MDCLTWRSRTKCLAIGLMVAAGLVCLGPTEAQTAKPNQVKGQGQQVGGNGQFGVVYSLKDGFNLAILSARYSIDPFISYELPFPNQEEKLLVVDFSIKNARPTENFFSHDGFMTAVDEKGELIQLTGVSLENKGEEAALLNLKPGQGLGQPELKNPLRVAYKMPAKSRIVKLIVNRPRLNSSEEVIRYYIAGATKAEAGESGDPKNIIKPLPDTVKDPSHPSGALALAEGKGALMTDLVSGCFALRIDSVAASEDKLQGEEEADAEKRYVVVTASARTLVAKELTMFEVIGGDTPQWEFTDADGERYHPVKFLKSKSGEDAEHTFKKGDLYSFRVVFQVPKAAMLKKFVIGASNARKWVINGVALP